MSNKPNSAAIGAFVMGAIIIATITVLFMSGSGWGKQTSTVVMVFEGSAKGLSVGAPVALRGVQIGQVTDIELILDTSTIDVIMLVEAEIRDEHIQQRGKSDGNLTEALIARGLRAQLNTQSLLTGLLYIQLDFHPNSELIFVETDSPHTQIPTIPTELQRLSREIEAINFAEVAENLKTMAEGMQRFINNKAFQNLPSDLKATLSSIEALSARLTQQLESTGPGLDNLVKEATTAVASINTEVPRISGSVVSTLSQLEKTADTLNETLGEVDHIVAEGSSTRYQLDNALRELALAGRAIQMLAKTLEEQPDALIRGRSEDK